jgi:hypothetical protein
VSNYHSHEAGCDSDHNADEYWDNDVHDDALKEANEATVSVVMTVGSVGSTRTVPVVRTAVVTIGLVRWDNMSSRTTLSSTSLQLRESISNNCCPFAEKGCAFLCIF